MLLKDPELLAAAADAGGTESLEALIRGASPSTANHHQPQPELDKVRQPHPSYHRGLKRTAMRPYCFSKKRSWRSCSRMQRLLNI